MSKIRKLFTKRRILVAGGVALLLVGASAAGIVSSQFFKKAPEEVQTTASGLPKEIDDIQNLRTTDPNEANKKIEDALNDSNASNDTKYMLYLQKGYANTKTDTESGATDGGGLEFFVKAATFKETQEVYTLIGEANYAQGKKADAKKAYQKAISLIDSGSPLASSDKKDLEQRITIIDEGVKDE
jgi:hypothetical protein